MAWGLANNSVKRQTLSIKCSSASRRLHNHPRLAASMSLSVNPLAFFHAISPFAWPPYITEAAALGLANSTSRVNTSTPFCSSSDPSLLSWSRICRGSGYLSVEGRSRATACDPLSTTNPFGLRRPRALRPFISHTNSWLCTGGTLAPSAGTSHSTPSTGRRRDRR